MRKKLFLLLLPLIIFFLSACADAESSLDNPTGETLGTPPAQMVASLYYRTFEEALREFATDVVVARYVGHRSFGQKLTEFEFVVIDRVLGYAADRIFVYAETNVNLDIEIIQAPREGTRYIAGDLAFSYDTDYLLALAKIVSPYANTKENGFTFIHNIVIDLEHPESSRMYSEPLYRHTTSLDFSSRTLSGQDIISQVEEIVLENTLAVMPIQSERMADIIEMSDHVWVVEIGEALRLSSEQATTDWRATDLYFVTSIEVLKGNIDPGVFGEDLLVIFFADTVLPGERHIVAVEPIGEGSSWFRFTSRNSLFALDQLDEILEILGQQ